jgi:hypothetical protein
VVNHLILRVGSLLQCPKILTEDSGTSGGMAVSTKRAWGPFPQLAEPATASSGYSRYSPRPSLEPVFLVAQLKRFHATLHDLRDFVIDFWDIDCAGEFGLSARFRGGCAVVATDYKLCVAVDDQIRIVACEDYLPVRFRLPERLHDLVDNLHVEIVFWLVNQSMGIPPAFQQTHGWRVDVGPFTAPV